MAVSEAALEPLDLRDYWRVVVRGKFIIAITTVLVVAGALVWTLLQPTTYRAELQIAVEPRSSRVLAGGPVEAASDTAGISTELFVLQSEALRRKVAEVVGEVPDVEFTTVPETNVIEITVKSATQGEAGRVATAYVDAYTQQRLDDVTRTLTSQKSSIERRIGDLQLQLADPLLPSSVAEGIRGRIYSLQTELNEVEAQLASPRPGVERI